MGRGTAPRIVIILVIASAGLVHAVDGPTPDSISAPKSVIDDEFFAFVVGLLVHDVEARYDLETLLAAFPVYLGSTEDTPINRLIELSRSGSGIGESPTVTVTFDAAFAYPLPIDILGYSPGEVEVSAILGFRETSYDSRIVSTDRRDAVEISPLYVLTLESGSLFIDFDGVVDALALTAYDDLDARTVLLFGYQEQWYAILAGTGHRDRIHEWTFNLKSTTFMRRPPRALRGVADQFIHGSP